MDGWMIGETFGVRKEGRKEGSKKGSKARGFFCFLFFVFHLAKGTFRSIISYNVQIRPCLLHEYECQAFFMSVNVFKCSLHPGPISLKPVLVGYVSIAFSCKHVSIICVRCQFYHYSSYTAFL